MVHRTPSADLRMVVCGNSLTSECLNRQLVAMKRLSGPEPLARPHSRTSEEGGQGGGASTSLDKKKVRCLSQEDRSKEKKKGGGDNRQRERWRDERKEERQVEEKEEKRKRREGNQKRRRKKRGYKKMELWKTCEDITNSSSKEMKRTDKERRKGRPERGREKLDGVRGEWENGFPPFHVQSLVGVDAASSNAQDNRGLMEGVQGERKMKESSWV